MKDTERTPHDLAFEDILAENADPARDKKPSHQVPPNTESGNDLGAEGPSSNARPLPRRRSLAHKTSHFNGRRGGAPNLRVLVVEDDFTSRVLLQTLLLEFGTVHIAVDGLEAIQAFCAARQSGQPYDLICMDVRMPEMNGMDALERIRLIEKQGGVQPAAGVKIFMTTAVRDLKTVSASFNAFCDAYLAKPLDAAKLVSEMRQHGLIA